MGNIMIYKKFKKNTWDTIQGPQVELQNETNLQQQNTCPRIQANLPSWLPKALLPPFGFGRIENVHMKFPTSSLLLLPIGFCQAPYGPIQISKTSQKKNISKRCAKENGWESDQKRRRRTTTYNLLSNKPLTNEDISLSLRLCSLDCRNCSRNSKIAPVNFSAGATLLWTTRLRFLVSSNPFTPEDTM